MYEFRVHRLFVLNFFSKMSSFKESKETKDKKRGREPEKEEETALTKRQKIKALVSELKRLTNASIPKAVKTAVDENFYDEKKEAEAGCTSCRSALPSEDMFLCSVPDCGFYLCNGCVEANSGELLETCNACDSFFCPRHTKANLKSCMICKRNNCTKCTTVCEFDEEKRICKPCLSFISLFCLSYSMYKLFTSKLLCYFSVLFNVVRAKSCWYNLVLLLTDHARLGAFGLRSNQFRQV
jgi:hypothetical protein